MKKTIWLVLMAVVSASVMAQQITNAPAAAPMSIPATPAGDPAVSNAAPVAPTLAESTNAPAKPKAAAKKKAPSKKKAKPAPAKAPVHKTSPSVIVKTEPLPPGPATVIASNVNVRGQARLVGEVLTRLTKGQTVTVLEEITLTNSAPDEPSAWAKILLPSERPVWISSLFVDTNNNVVSVARLNLRGGPGENYSVLGRLNKGDTFKELDRKENWIKIEAPTNAYAFVAAQYLRSEAAAPAEIASATTTNTPAAEAAPTPATVAEAPAIASAPTNAPAVPAAETAAAVTDTNAPLVAETGTNAAPTEPTPAPETAPAENTPPPKRIIQREGLVRGTISIQAPSPFCLVNLDNGRTMDYLVSPSKEIDLRRFKGMRVIVTGEEGLDQRWGNTPVLLLDQIEVIE